MKFMETPRPCRRTARMAASTSALEGGVAVSGRTRFVLSAGGAMASYQAGAVVALFKEGVAPDAIYGCSAGALNAAFLAARPDLSRARELVRWWTDPGNQRVLSPRWMDHLRGVRHVVGHRGRGLLDDRPLRKLVAANVPAHDISELAIPITVTTTCLDCGRTRRHDTGDTADLLVASCALPGLFPPVRLGQGHRHVDGGVLCGVPLQAAVDDAGPDDVILVVDCGASPVTCGTGDDRGCALPAAAGATAFVAPSERSRAALDVMLQAFAVARAAANRASIGSTLDDPRVQVVPHITDAWAAGLVTDLGSGPRDLRTASALAAAGEAATAQWLSRRGAGTRQPA